MHFSSHIIINAPAETVWDIIGRQFDRIGEWATAIPASAAVPPDVPGEPTVTAAPVAGRVCDTGIRMLPQATEMIIAYSDSDRTLTYQATGMPAYVRVARNRWTITAVDSQRTQAAFEAVFAPRGILGRLLAGWLLVQIGRTGRHLLGDLKHYAEHGVPSPRKQAQLDRAGRDRPSLRPRRSKGATGTR
jgi:Polyketide cyclase / dehydrase and lipid transport